MKTIYPLVSIIIVNFNGRPYLATCLESILRTDYPNYEILVIDNCSSDGSPDFLSKYFPNVLLIKLKSNMGFACACNVGIVHSKGEYVVLLNADIIAEPDWLRKLVETANNELDIGILAPITPPFEYRGNFEVPSFYKRLRDLTMVSGAAMMIRKSILDFTGLFDENFFMYWEDTEFCWRSYLFGFRCVLDYDSIIYHKVGGSKDFSSIDIEKESKKNGIYTHIKLMNYRSILGYLCLEAVRNIYHFLRGGNTIKSFLYAIKWNIQNIRHTLNQRIAFQSRRRVSYNDFRKTWKKQRLNRVLDKKYLWNR